MKNIYFYETTVFHKRIKPFNNYFSYSYPSMMINLENIRTLKKKFFFSINSFNLLSFYEKDHGPQIENSNLYKWILKKIIKKFKYKKKLSIYLFSIPRFLGYVFNPISIYFCINSSNKLVFVLYEVKNTHHEQHTYLFKINNSNKKKHSTIKKFYVSPFLKMRMKYDFHLKSYFPNINLNINVLGKEMSLLTGFVSKEKKLTNINIIKTIISNFFFAQKIMVLIHYQAVKIFIKSKNFFFKQEKKKDTISYHE